MVKKPKEGLGLLFDVKGWRVIQPTALRSLKEQPATLASTGTWTNLVVLIVSPLRTWLQNQYVQLKPSL